jgi:hypothetical protein
LPEAGTALDEPVYGKSAPKAGVSSRRGSAVPKGLWVFVKRIKHPGLRARLLANGQARLEHGNTAFESFFEVLTWRCALVLGVLVRCLFRFSSSKANSSSG